MNCGGRSTAQGALNLFSLKLKVNMVVGVCSKKHKGTGQPEKGVFEAIVRSVESALS